jgi:hypothetical protein
MVGSQLRGRELSKLSKLFMLSREAVQKERSAGDPWGQLAICGSFWLMIYFQRVRGFWQLWPFLLWVSRCFHTDW